MTIADSEPISICKRTLQPGSGMLAHLLARALCLPPLASVAHIRCPHASRARTPTFLRWPYANRCEETHSTGAVGVFPCDRGACLTRHAMRPFASRLCKAGNASHSAEHVTDLPFVTVYFIVTRSGMRGKCQQSSVQRHQTAPYLQLGAKLTSPHSAEF